MKIRPNSKVVPVIPVDASYNDVFDAFKVEIVFALVFLTLLMIDEIVKFL